MSSAFGTGCECVEHSVLMQTDELVPEEHSQSGCVSSRLAIPCESLHNGCALSLESGAREEDSSLVLESSDSSCEICSLSRLI